MKKATKNVPKPTRNKVEKTKVLGRFEIPPSRQPLRYKALWELEDVLVNEYTTADITGELLLTHYSSFSSLYSIDYLWNDYYP